MKPRKLIVTDDGYIGYGKSLKIQKTGKVRQNLKFQKILNFENWIHNWCWYLQSIRLLRQIHVQIARIWQYNFYSKIVFGFVRYAQGDLLYDIWSVPLVCSHFWVYLFGCRSVSDVNEMHLEPKQIHDNEKLKQQLVTNKTFSLK
jgi:hypothetical protein